MARPIVPTVAPSVEDCAYAAGFIDGEGCVYVMSSTARVACPRVDITQVNVGPLRWLRDRWGGGLYFKANGRDRKYCWVLCISGNRAIQICEDVRPWLKVKALQADNVLAFGRTVNRGAHYKLSEEETARRQILAEASSILNRQAMEVNE